jgi:hypothetical protein
MKFSVGQPVGGPATHVAGDDSADPVASEILALPGVVSVFMTSDFVTVSKSADGDWDSLIPECVGILERHYG